MLDVFPEASGPVIAITPPPTNNFPGKHKILFLNRLKIEENEIQ